MHYWNATGLLVDYERWNSFGIIADWKNEHFALTGLMPQGVF